MKQIYVRPKATTVTLRSNCSLAAGTNAAFNANSPHSGGNASAAAARGGSGWEDDDE